VPGKTIAAIIHYYVDTSDPNAVNDLLEYEAKLVEKAFTDAWPKFKNCCKANPVKPSMSMWALLTLERMY